LESSRCSCSLCSSQGAVAHSRNRPRRGATRSGARGHGEVLYTLRRRARRRKRAKPPRGGPVPFLQNGIVMTAEPRLGYGPSRRHIEAPPS